MDDRLSSPSETSAEDRLRVAALLAEFGVEIEGFFDILIAAQLGRASSLRQDQREQIERFEVGIQSLVDGDDRTRRWSTLLPAFTEMVREAIYGSPDNELRSLRAKNRARQKKLEVLRLRRRVLLKQIHDQRIRNLALYREVHNGRHRLGRRRLRSAPIRHRASRRVGAGSRAGPDDPDGDPDPSGYVGTPAARRQKTGAGR